MKHPRRLTLRYLFILLLIMVSNGYPIDYYVDLTYGDNLNSGTSWSKAKKNIRNALLVVTNGDTIHVASGDYIGGNLVLINDAVLLGGYPPGGGKRDPRTFISIIDISRGIGSCIIGADGAVIDGFTLIRGTGLDTGGNTGGGGVLCDGTSPIIQNNIIQMNSAELGGGIYCRNSSALIQNNTFTRNTGIGGAIFLTDSEAVIMGNIFMENSGGAYGGGAICCDGLTSSYIANNFFWNNDSGFSFAPVGGAIFCRNNAIPTIINNTFMSNSCGFRGGAIQCQTNSSPTIRNNVFFKNYGYGTISASDTSSPKVDHNVFWGNTGGAVYLQDVTPYMTVLEMDTNVAGCISNYDCDPMVKDFLSGDYHLLPGSCCIDKANPEFAPTLDIDGDTRPYNSLYDIGADEYTPPPIPTLDFFLTCILISFLTIIFILSAFFDLT